MKDDRQSCLPLFTVTVYHLYIFKAFVSLTIQVILKGSSDAKFTLQV